MIDFIKATKYTGKDSKILANCKPICQYSSGWDQYALEGCEKMKVYFRPDAGLLRLEGSLPYFLNGHNWSFSTEEFVKCVELINSLLGNVGLWDADVMTFENGVILPTELRAKEYIARHSALKGTHLRKYVNEKNAGKLAIWQGKGYELKVYDAGANILMKQGLKRRIIIEEAGWNPDSNYIKVEARYHKPEGLNNGRAVSLEMLQNANFHNRLKEDLMEKYHQLTPEKTLIIPSDKKDLTSIDAVLITFAEMQGLSLEELKRRIYGTINQAECLSKADKDARKAQIRKSIAKLNEAPESQWDLTEKLIDALQKEK